ITCRFARRTTKRRHRSLRTYWAGRRRTTKAVKTSCSWVMSATSSSAAVTPSILRRRSILSASSDESITSPSALRRGYRCGAEGAGESSSPGPGRYGQWRRHPFGAVQELSHRNAQRLQSADQHDHEDHAVAAAEFCEAAALAR